MAYNIISLITEHYLDPAARAKVAMLLAADTDTLTGHYIANEATWADKYRDRDRNTTRIRYESDTAVALCRYRTCSTEPNLAAACSAIRFYLRASRPPKDRHGLSAPRIPDGVIAQPSALRFSSRLAGI